MGHITRLGDTKLCKTCGEFLPLSSFYVRGNEYYSPSCKPCTIKINMEQERARKQKLGSTRPSLPKRLTPKIVPYEPDPRLAESVALREAEAHSDQYKRACRGEMARAAKFHPKHLTTLRICAYVDKDGIVHWREVVV